MQTGDLIERARILVDSSGKKKAVLLDYDSWTELIGDLQDLEEIDRVRESREGYISWDEAKKELRLNETLR